jgi:hypothetical protein
MTDEKDGEPKRFAVFFCAEKIAAGELERAACVFAVQDSLTAAEGMHEIRFPE